MPRAREEDSLTFSTAARLGCSSITIDRDVSRLEVCGGRRSCCKSEVTPAAMPARERFIDTRRGAVKQTTVSFHNYDSLPASVRFLLDSTIAP
jgi:hypothetical protein